MNELLGAVIVASSLSEINNSIKSRGFNDYNDLVSAIRHLDIEIAKSKDDNKPYEEKLKLRDEYVELKNQYDAAYQREEERKQKNNLIFGIIFGVIIAGGLIALFVWLGTIL